MAYEIKAYLVVAQDLPVIQGSLTKDALQFSGILLSPGIQISVRHWNFEKEGRDRDGIR